MREIAGRIGKLWISSTPRDWNDQPIARMVQAQVSTEPSSNGTPLHGGIRYVKSGAGIYVNLGATYSPAPVATLTIEVAVLTATEPYEAKMNAEIAALILAEAQRVLAQIPVLRGGVLRFDQLRIDAVDRPPWSWRYGTRVLIGLLSLGDYETLLDEDIIGRLEAFDKAMRA